MTQILEILKSVGNWTGDISQSIIVFFSNQGVKTTLLSAKIINLLIILLGIWIVLKIATSLRTVVKWLIFILLVILGISIITSFV